MIKTKQGGLIWLVVIVTVLLSMVVMPVSVVADDGIRDPLEDRFRRGGGEEGSGETGFPKAPAALSNGTGGDSGNIGVKGLVDMLWCEEVSGGVEIDGAAPWKDLDGDGRADVVVVTQEDLGDDQRLFTIIAKNGGTGQHLWEQSLTLEEWLMGWLSVYVRPGADLDGDGCEDVLVHALRYLVDGQLRCTVIAKSGRTGQHLWEESITADESDMFAYPAGDLDGDGRGDVMVETFQYLEEDGEDWKLIAKRGYDGHHLWEEATTDNTTRSLSSYPVKADLDGDGGADVMVQICRALGMAGYEFTVIAKNGRTGDHLWEQTVTRTDDCYWYTPYYTYDLNGALP